MFTSGHDFFENGNAAVCTVHGDVWVVSGIDARLEKLTWKRFATGLYQPLGLKIVRNLVHVICRDGIVVCMTGTVTVRPITMRISITTAIRPEAVTVTRVAWRRIRRGTFISLNVERTRRMEGPS